MNELQSMRKSLFSSVAERRLLTEFFLVHSEKKTRKKFRTKQRGWQEGEKRVGKNLYKTRLLRSFLLSVPLSRLVPELDTNRRKDRHFFHKSLHIVNNCCKFAVEKETAGKCFMRNKVLGLFLIDWRLGFYVVSKAPEVCP